MSKTTVASLETRVVALEGMVKHHQSMVESLTRALAKQQAQIDDLSHPAPALRAETVATHANNRRVAMALAREEARRTGKCVAVKFN